MLFNSISFFLFFAIVTILYWLLHHKYRWMLLLVASCYFYMFFKPIYILILGFTIVIDYFAGIFIQRAESLIVKKRYLIISLFCNIGVLAIFKYYNFINLNLSHLFGWAGFSNPLPFLNILLPIGLSFHTFQAMSYTIEVYRGNQQAEKHFGIYALYVMFYPQLVAGPIERPQNILPQLHQEKTLDYASVASGLRLMVWGLMKKMIIADHLSMYVDKIYSSDNQIVGFPCLFAMVFFSIQIYCDFSGYSDIAIGSARVMGISLMRNFRMPYFATSINDFWSKWHISLSTWFRDYLYIPLGGNRVNTLLVCRNLAIVFLLSGLWHGANYTFIIWGALHATFVIGAHLKKIYLDRGLSFQLPKIVYRLGVFVIVSFAWVFFRAPKVNDAFQMLKNVFRGYNFLHPGLTTNIISGYNFYICVVSTFFLIMIEWLQLNYNLYQWFLGRSLTFRICTYSICVFCILFFGVFNSTKFIYFQF